MNDYVCPETEAGSSAVTALIAIRAETRRKDVGMGGLGECLRALLFSVGEKLMAVVGEAVEAVMVRWCVCVSLQT